MDNDFLDNLKDEIEEDNPDIKVNKEKLLRVLMAIYLSGGIKSGEDNTL